MKQIQPFTLWVNGQQQTATLFSLIIINDSSDSEQHGDPSYTPVISVLRKRRKLI